MFSLICISYRCTDKLCCQRQYPGGYFSVSVFRLGLVVCRIVLSKHSHVYVYMYICIYVWVCLFLPLG